MPLSNKTKRTANFVSDSKFQQKPSKQKINWDTEKRAKLNSKKKKKRTIKSVKHFEKNMEDIVAFEE